MKHYKLADGSAPQEVKIGDRVFVDSNVKGVVLGCTVQKKTKSGFISQRGEINWSEAATTDKFWLCQGVA